MSYVNRPETTMKKRFVVVSVLAVIAILTGAGFVLKQDGQGAAASSQRPEPSLPMSNAAALRTEKSDRPRAQAAEKQKAAVFDHRAGAVTDVTDHEAARLKALLKEITVKLTPEERDLLEKHPPETLGDAISDAELAYRNANDTNRAELEEHYLALLNLAAKFAPRPPPMPPDEVERYRRYSQALEAKKEQLARLPEKEAADLRKSIKEEIFRQEETQQ